MTFTLLPPPPPPTHPGKQISYCLYFITHLFLLNLKKSPEPKLFLIYHSVIQSKHFGDIFVNFLCFVSEILAVGVCTFSQK